MKLLNSKVRSIYVSLDDGVPVAGSVWAPVGGARPLCHEGSAPGE